MADTVVNEKNDDNDEVENSGNERGLEKESLGKNSQLPSLDEARSEITHVSSIPRKEDTNDTVPISDKPEDKLIADKGAIMRSPQRKSRSACRARSRDLQKCQMNIREMIGKHELRNEELEQLEGDLRERLDMLECSMPAVMVWNILRTAQGAPPSAVRRLMEKQFQEVHSACNITVPSTPSQHYDYRVREVEAERKEAVRRAEEARALLTDKEAAIVERQKRLEEVKKCNQEKKERIQQLNREIAQVKEAMKNAKGDDTSCQTGECGVIRCKEKLLGDIGSLSSIGSKDLECFAKLQELAESEVCMKQQISELERREEMYMRTLQQADELWSKMDGDASSDVNELQEQLKLKTAANQQLADQVCHLEDEQERLKKRLLTCTDELAKFTEKMLADAEVGSKGGVATVTDRGVEAQATTISAFTSASPQMVDIDSTAHPQTKDEESTFAPESKEKGISVSAKTFDKEIEAIVDLIDREVDRPVGMGIDTGVGDEAVDDQTRTVDHPRKPPSERPTKVPLERQEKIPETLESFHWDDGYPPDTIAKDMVESSTGMDHPSDHRRVSTAEMPVQATVKMVEEPVGGREAEDIAEIVREIPKRTDGAKSDAKAVDKVGRATTDESSIEVIDDPGIDEQRFHKLPETRDKGKITIVERKNTDTHETTEETEQSASDKKSIIEHQTKADEDKDVGIDKIKQLPTIVQKIGQAISEKKESGKRQTAINNDSDDNSDQMGANDQAQRQDLEEKIVEKRKTTTEKNGKKTDDPTNNKIAELKQRTEHSDPVEKLINEVAKADDEATSTDERYSRRLTRAEKDSKKDSIRMSQDNKARVEKSDQPDPEKQDSFIKRIKNVVKPSRVPQDKMENDSDEDAQKSDYSDSETKAATKPTKSVSKYPKRTEKKERKERSSKHKSRDTKIIETANDDEIPEAWKNWDWDKGCPPDEGCNLMSSPTRVDDKRPKDVSTLETQVQATVEMRERSVGGRGSEDVAEIRRQVPIGRNADECVLSREELRNWYNTVNSIHHTISQCPNCQSQVDATEQLMTKMNNRLEITTLADEKVSITNDEMSKSLAYMEERPIETLRDSRAEVDTSRRSKLLSVPDLESISSPNLNNLSTSQLLEEDEKLPTEKDATMDISAAETVDTADQFPETKPSESDIKRNELDDQGKKMPSVLLRPSLQEEDEFFMARTKERQVQETESDKALSREETGAITGSEERQHESIMPSAMEDGKIMESGKKPEGQKEPPKAIDGVEERKEAEGKTKRDDVDKSPTPRPKIEADIKIQPPGISEACPCSPRICRPVITCIPEPYTEETQTSSELPRTLHRLKLKTKTESTWHSPDAILWHRPLILPRRREDKSTLTTIGVGIQADSTLRRERITHGKIDRKDDCTYSGLIPRKIEFGGSKEHTSRRHPDARLPTPVSNTVAELTNSLRAQPSGISDENEIAVTQYTGKSLTPKSSDLCCIDCGRPLTPEPTLLSLKDNPRTIAKTQKGLMHALKKLTSSTSCVERKRNLCCDCKVLHAGKKTDATEDEQTKTAKDSALCKNLGCPDPSDIKNKKTKESSKPSKKKRKPEKKDQSVTASIPRSKQKKNSKNKKGTDDKSVSSIPESKVQSPLVKSRSKHSGNSATESCDEKSCNQTAPEREVDVKRLAMQVSSSRAPAKCGCDDDSNVQVPYTNYSSIFKANITKNQSDCSSSNESNI